MAHLYVFEMRFDYGTLGSGERSLPFELLVLTDLNYQDIWTKPVILVYLCKMGLR